MGDDTKVRRLVEILSAYFIKETAVEENLRCSLTFEFLTNMQDVLFAKQIAIFHRWRFYLDTCSERMLHSPEMFLKYVYFACLLDAKSKFHVFERFLRAFAFILRVCIETRCRKGVNFCKLVPDIFMVFYDKVLKRSFKKRKGIHQFMQFINDPKYLKSECIVRDVANSYKTYSKIPNDHLKESYERVCGIEELPDISDFMLPEVHPESSSLAKKVLQITRPEFIPLMNAQDLKVNNSSVVKQKTKIIAKTKSEEILKKVETSEHCPSLNFDPKIDVPDQMADNTWCENVIEAVRRYNRSKTSCHTKSKDCSLPKECIILEQLKCKIESLIEVLDKYDQE